MDKQLKLVESAVREAGIAIAEMRKKGVDVSVKDNKDVLTQADLLANQILHSQLMGAFPGAGWLSEESVDNADRLNIQRVWVVDPIDGTREYIAGIPEYAVSVALVENGLPVIACVFNPERGEMFSALRGGGVYLNGKPVKCKQTCGDKLSLLASRSEVKRGEWDRFQHHEIKVIGSIAYKLALIAAGFADATFSLGPKSEWDIAAGVLLVQEAGGIATDKSGQSFVFNQPQVKVNGIIAASGFSINNVMSIIAVR
ncbi:MAG TPA: 3'(2'),5'-bisphosphate nucleotidase CysQ [Gammaproteobacteria bacterium]|jgi:myo-inositol-1(or 4)-monophosphatase|nr:3'(2'),5'-bisphosphate nucleotidase CysQ [Gammaproteobacteria bacterium]